MRPRLDPRSVCVGFVLDKVDLGEVSLWALRFSPLSVIPSMLRTSLHLHVAFVRMTSGRSWEPSNKAKLLRKSGRLERKESTSSYLQCFKVSWGINFSVLRVSKPLHVPVSILRSVLMRCKVLFSAVTIEIVVIWNVIRFSFVTLPIIWRQDDLPKGRSPTKQHSAISQFRCSLPLVYRKYIFNFSLPRRRPPPCVHCSGPG
jgi:hypothetical protein